MAEGILKMSMTLKTDINGICPGAKLTRTVRVIRSAMSDNHDPDYGPWGYRGGDKPVVSSDLKRVLKILVPIGVLFWVGVGLAMAKYVFHSW